VSGGVTLIPMICTRAVSARSGLWVYNNEVETAAFEEDPCGTSHRGVETSSQGGPATLMWVYQLTWTARRSVVDFKGQLTRCTEYAGVDPSPFL
jgi:hypothetical protein